MLKKLYPYEYVEGVFSIDYQKLYQIGYKGIIFDIDNTLVPHGKDSTTEVDNLFKILNEIGFKTLLLSNNNEQRVKRFVKNIDSKYIYDAEKPNIDGYMKAVEKLKLKKEEVLYIGDQIFTDILGANKAGIDNILVKYIGFYDKGKKGIKRNLEKLILKLYSKSKKYQNRIGDIQKKGGCVGNARR